jgi:hypothetical protein
MIFVCRFEPKEKKKMKKFKLEHKNIKEKSKLHIKTLSLLHKSELQGLMHS